MKNVPFNSECQTKGCKGSFQQIENFVYQEHTSVENSPMIIKFKQNHIITAYKCDTCGRIHGKVKLSNNDVVEFFEAVCSPITFQTPSNYGINDNVSTWKVKSCVPVI